jgi:hypothetical protein
VTAALTGDLDDDTAALADETIDEAPSSSGLSTCGFSLRFVTATMRELFLSPRSTDYYVELLELAFLLQHMLSIQSFCSSGEEVVRVLRAVQTMLLDLEYDRNNDRGVVKLAKPMLQVQPSRACSVPLVDDTAQPHPGAVFGGLLAHRRSMTCS